MELQAFLIERAMISFDKPFLLGVMRIADEYGYSESMTKAHKGSREVAALRSSDPTGVTSKVMEAGKPCSANVWATAARAVSAVKSARTWCATRTEVPLSMILSVSTTCCFLPWDQQEPSRHL